MNAKSRKQTSVRSVKRIGSKECLWQHLALCELVVPIVIVMNPNELIIEVAEIFAQLGLQHPSQT